MSAIFRSLALNMQEKKETTEWTKKPNQAPAVDATAGSKKIAPFTPVCTVEGPQSCVLEACLPIRLFFERIASGKLRKPGSMLIYWRVIIIRHIYERLSQ